MVMETSRVVLQEIVPDRIDRKSGLQVAWIWPPDTLSHHWASSRNLGPILLLSPVEEGCNYQLVANADSSHQSGWQNHIALVLALVCSMVAVKYAIFCTAIALRSLPAPPFLVIPLSWHQISWEGRPSFSYRGGVVLYCVYYLPAHLGS